MLGKELVLIYNVQSADQSYQSFQHYADIGVRAFHLNNSLLNLIHCIISQTVPQFNRTKFLSIFLKFIFENISSLIY